MLAGVAVLTCFWLVAAEGRVVDASSYMDPARADCGFQSAIDLAADQGGGLVRIPAGKHALRRGLVLRSKVTLVGAGMDQTILVPARKTIRLNVAAEGPADGRVALEAIPSELGVGSAVVACGEYPPSWYGSPRPACVLSIDKTQRTVVLESPYGLSKLKPGKGCLTFGDSAALASDVRHGDTEIHLRDARLFRPGDELALGEPPNESLLAHAFVRDVRGNTLILESPARIDMPAWPHADKIGNTKVNALVWALFPLVHAANVEDCGVRDLTVQGHGFAEIRPMQTRYTLAGIHIFNATRLVLDRVAVRDWPSDGISLQTGIACRVSRCEVTRCLGNGLHPGTGLKASIFEENQAAENGAGLYFCWHNKGHVLRKNQFVRNRGGGLTGLGNPGDRNILIQENRIADNGGPGVEINGGQRSGTVLRGNTIENNSRSEAGKWPGIALYASVEDAREYIIRANTIRDSQESATQWIGIEERNGMYRDKPTCADENLIEENVFSGHRKADVVLSGPATRCEANGNINIRRTWDASR